MLRSRRFRFLPVLFLAIRGASQRGMGSPLPEIWQRGLVHVACGLE
jgi:hypothetical protein